MSNEEIEVEGEEIEDFDVPQFEHATFAEETLDAANGKIKEYGDVGCELVSMFCAEGKYVGVMKRQNYDPGLADVVIALEDLSELLKGAVEDEEEDVE